MAETSVPGPAGRPLIGSLLELRRDPIGALARARREHGDVVRLTGGLPGLRMKLYAVFSAEGVQEVLASQAVNFRKDNHIYEEIRESIGNGLVTSQDDEYLRQRRLIQPLFTNRRVQGYGDAAYTQAASLAERWGSAPDGVVDLVTEMPDFTVRTLSSILFGADMDTAVEVIRRRLEHFVTYTLDRGFSPVNIPRHWPTPANRRAAAGQRELYAVCDRIIAERLSGRAGSGAAAHSGARGDDMLSLFIDAHSEHGEAVVADELRDQLLVFLLAGSETTATSLAVALHLLASHPEAQERAHAEIDGALAGRRPGAADLEDLPYLTMVLKEAMRLHSPIQFIGRRSVEDMVIGGHRIPAGADVVVCSGVTHRHPAYWPDPDRFDPERFSPEAEAGRHRYAWFPFGGGPRACIGQRFSMLESVLCLAVLLQRFTITPVDTGVELGRALMIQDLGRIRCRTVPRSPGSP
ncbi:cytochrome P450 [Streptomyces sp. NPDC020597]|uniref:cytochrome P450 n=1 Tax=unclassified Streptomyces TaxID=2593676 RepID=UPI0037B54801